MKKNNNQISADKHTKRAGWMWLFLIIIALLTILYINFVKEMTYKNVYKNITEISLCLTSKVPSVFPFMFSPIFIILFTFSSSVNSYLLINNRD